LFPDFVDNASDHQQAVRNQNQIPMKPIFEKINKLEYQSFYLEEVIKPYFIDLWHFHPEVEILYIREGVGTKYVGDSFSAFYPGDIAVIGSNTPHVWSSDEEYLLPEKKLVSSAICIQFTEDFMGRSSDIPELDKIHKFLKKAKQGIEFTGKTRDALIMHLEELPSRNGMERLIGLLTVLDIMSKSNDIKYLSSQSYKPSIINSEDKDRMEVIFRYVIKNYPNKISLEEVASLVSLTPHSFCRYFKSRTTKVFSSFVNEVRIGNACKLLIENKETIAQISAKSGFNYLSNFNRLFKKIKGMTPSEFQHKYTNPKFDTIYH
jgi:AraC-like DNA-binding protein